MYLESPEVNDDRQFADYKEQITEHFKKKENMEHTVVRRLLDTLNDRLDVINRETTELREQMIQTFLVDTQKYLELEISQITDDFINGFDKGYEFAAQEFKSKHTKLGCSFLPFQIEEANKYIKGQYEDCVVSENGI